MSRIGLLNIGLGIVVGLALGLAYAWVVNPVQYVDVTPDSLRADYKTDYVVMIAQAYAADSDLDLARARLATLQVANPGQFVAEVTAQQVASGAPLDDLRVLNDLANALGAVPSIPQTAPP